MANTVLSIKHATVRRDGKDILKDASLEIDEGENIAIVGPNGAGKSTLVSVIARKVYPLRKDEYSNEIFGSERWIISELRPMIGFVSASEDEFFTTRYSVIEIVTSGLHSSLGFDFHHKVKERDWEKGEKALREAGLLHLKSRTLDTLSTGEKRRVLVARAEITEPRLLILDEATAGMDFPSRGDFRRQVSAWARPERNIIMVTHELSEIIPEAKRVILMKGGEIIFDGRKEEALTEERLSDLYERRIYLSVKDGIYDAFC